MARKEKMPPIVLTREATVGHKPTQEELARDAAQFIANLHKEDRPQFGQATKDPKKWLREDQRRRDKESEARIAALSENVWLAQEIYIQLWKDCVDEMIMDLGVPEDEAFKPNRIKVMKPLHPSEGLNARAFREAQAAIERILPTTRTDDYEEYIGRLFEEVKRRWYAEHAKLKDDIQYRAANQNNEPEN